MALLKLSNNKYIKINKNGFYEIYKSRAARTRNKKATPYTEILKKYNEVMDSLLPAPGTDNEERAYYDPEGFNAELLAWQEEFVLYLTNLNAHTATGKYPLMSQYYEDVENSIPQIIESGIVNLGPVDTDEEMYELVKRLNLFGDTADLKDI